MDFHGSEWQHEYMAEFQRPVIEQILREIDSQSTSSQDQLSAILPSNSSNVYEALSWIGLQSTSAMRNLPPGKVPELIKLFQNYMTKDVDKNCD